MLVFTSSLFADKLADIKKSTVLKVVLKIDYEPFGFKIRSSK